MDELEDVDDASDGPDVEEVPGAASAASGGKYVWATGVYGCAWGVRGGGVRWPG